MTAQFARYVVIIDRQVGEQDGGAGLYHDGDGAAAADQLTNELQEAWETGVEGQFRVIGRSIVPGTTGLDALPAFYEDDPVDPRLLSMLELERSLRKP